MNSAILTFTDWFPALFVGIFFTAFGLLKLYGLSRGIEGGAGKPFRQKLLGTCPGWQSRTLRLGFPLLLLGIGLFSLAVLAWQCYANLHTQ